MDSEELQVLDSLIVLAFLEGVARGTPPLAGPEPHLAPRDQDALDALGPDLARRILGEEAA